MIGKSVILSAQVVLEGDPAIIGGDYQAYIDSGYDLSKLQLDTSERPTIFSIKPLTYRQKMQRDSLGGTMDKIFYTLRCGLTGIENYLVFDHGQVRELDPLQLENGMVSEAWLEKTSLPSDHLLQVAVAISAISEAKAPLSRRSDGAPTPGGLSEKSQDVTT